MELEEWRLIPGCEWYEASSLGRVRSIDHVTHCIQKGRPRSVRYKGRVLSSKPDHTGYVYFSRGKRGGGKFLVSRAVCLAFHGPAPTSLHEAAHLDGKTLNNREDNLCWATHLENEGHKRIHCTLPEGDNHHNAKLKSSDIDLIFDRYIRGEKLPALATYFGVSDSLINNVLRRKAWRHIRISPEKTLQARVVARMNLSSLLRTPDA